MIIFLALLYVGALALAVKVGVIRLNTFWKLSPLLWMVLLFVILFLPILQVQVDAGKRELDRQEQLLRDGAGSKSDVDVAQVGYTSLLSQWHSAQADLRSAEQAVTAAIASLDADQANARSVELELKQLVEAELPRAKAVAREAELAAESMIGGEHTSVADVRAQLAGAEYDLDQTTVRAPSEGYVAFLQLRPGQRVANLPLRSWMAFIDTAKTEITVTVQQYALRNVRPGQSAEVTFKLRPGEVFPATVERIAYFTSAGQLQPSGQIASSSTIDPTAEPIGVVLTIDEATLDPSLLTGGAKGSAAIYTDSMKATHIIRKVMLRMDAWMNYIIP